MELVVYTTSVGYEFELPETVQARNVRYVCFSDVPRKQNSGWEIFLIEPLFEDDPARSSREPKILAHNFLSNFDNSLYIDSRVQLKQNPLDLWNYLIPTPNMVFGAFLHSKRDTLADEFKAVVQSRLDDVQNIKSQWNSYKRLHPDIILAKPVWGGVLARRHNNQKCKRAMQKWYSHVLRYSRRDQLSLPLILRCFEEEDINLSSCSIHCSDFHLWPIGPSIRLKCY